jgi:hypothetical protein
MVSAVNLAPSITSATPVNWITLGRYEAVLLTEVETDGIVQYLHILKVDDPVTDEPCLFVTAEKHAAPGGLPPYCLCSFQRSGHVMHGAYGDIADIDVFETRALEIVRQCLRVGGNRGKQQ